MDSKERAFPATAQFMVANAHKYAMTQLPLDQHITYQKQFRKCGKASCSTCRTGQGHGPYWYAYWREGARLRSGYVGKVHPSLLPIAAVTTTMPEQTVDRHRDTSLAIPA